jgi:hypothetical protein
MKTITTTLNGLTSSLLLNIGLNQIAQKLDPVSHFPTELCSQAHAPAISYPSSFAAKSSR